MLFSPEPKERREDLFDRDEELRSFQRFLEVGGPICLILGLRRTGKSSLLKVGLRLSNLPHVVLDLRVLEEKARVSYGDFIRVLNEAFNKLLSERKALAKHLIDFLKVVDGVEVSGLRVYFKWGKRERLSLASFFERVNDFAESCGFKVVLAFDEAQELAMLRGVRFDALLAYAYDNLRNLKIVLTGSKVGLLYKFLKIEDPSSPLFGRALWKIELSYFNEELSKAFLKTGLAQASIAYSEDEVEEVVKAFNGVPGWLSSYGYSRLQGIPHRDALKAEKEKASLLLAHELNNFLKLRPAAKDRYVEIIRALALGAKKWSEIKGYAEAKLGEAIPPKNFTELLNKLVDSGFVVKEDGGYRLADPLLAEAAKKIKL